MDGERERERGREGARGGKVEYVPSLVLDSGSVSADSVQVQCEKMPRNPTGILLGTLHLAAEAALQNNTHGHTQILSSESGELSFLYTYCTVFTCAVEI